MTPLIWVGAAVLTALAAKKAVQSSATGAVRAAGLPQGPTGFVVVPGRVYQMIIGITLGVDPRANFQAARDSVLAVLASHGMSPMRVEIQGPLPLPGTFAWRIEGQYLGPQPVELVSHPGIFFLFAREAPPAMLPPGPHAPVPPPAPPQPPAPQAQAFPGGVPGGASAPAATADTDDALANARKRVLGSIFAKDTGAAASQASSASPAPQASQVAPQVEDETGLSHGARLTQDARNRMMAEREAAVILGENGMASPAHADAPNGVAKPGTAPKAKGSAGTPSKGAGS